MEKIEIKLDQSTLPENLRYVGFEAVCEEGQNPHYGRYVVADELIHVSDVDWFDMWSGVVRWWYVDDPAIIASVDAVLTLPIYADAPSDRE